MSTRLSKLLPAAWLACAACGTPEQPGVEEATFLQGDFGRASGSVTGLDAREAHARVRDVLHQVAPTFGLRTEDLFLKRVSTDARGHQYLRYGQTWNGHEVIGAEVLLFLDPEGRAYAVNSSAREGPRAAIQPRLSQEAAVRAARDATDARGTEAQGTGRLVYVRREDGPLVLAHEVRVTGTRAGLPVKDTLYVDALGGEVVLRDSDIQPLLQRAVYSAGNTATVPGTLQRGEGQGSTGDAHVDGNYEHLGTTWQCLQANFGRDSYDNAGAPLKSTVHYETGYVNAYWDGSLGQMVYGDGDGVEAGPLGRSLDVTVHELAHAVTDAESDLLYQNESGALNEALSDILAAHCEAWTKGWVVDEAVFRIGEDVWTPATPGDALRYLASPTADGSSRDYYPERYVGTVDSGGVHWNSGIVNLAFYLLSQGGTHPRGKTGVAVTGIGIQKAGRIFYEANAHCFTASSDFANARACTEQKAEQLYGAAEKAAVTAAWDAVGVPGPPPCPTVVLSNGVAVSGVAASAGSWTCAYTLSVPAGQGSLKFELSGGTGDGDLHVKYGAEPTATSHDCRPYQSGNAETCTFNNPAAGTWYVKVKAYSHFSGASLKGTYTASTVLTNGVATAPYSGAVGSWRCWTLEVPAGRAQLVFTQAGGTGDADLYVKLGTPPTTGSYHCRPWLGGNTETCTLTSPAAGTWYACSYGYGAYSGTTLKGTY